MANALKVEPAWRPLPPPWLPSGQVDLGLRVVEATEHGLDPPAGIDGHERGRRIAGLGQRRGLRVDGVLLQPVVDGGVDAQATAVELGVGELARGHQRLAHVVDDVVRPELGVAHRARPGDAGLRHHVGPGRGHGPVPLDLRDVVLLQHVVEHRRAPEDGGGPTALGVGVGRGRAGVGRPGRADQAGQVGRLGQRQRADVLVEVGLRRGLDAVGAAPEVDGVQVAVEDLGLRAAAARASPPAPPP